MPWVRQDWKKLLNGMKQFVQDTQTHKYAASSLDRLAKQELEERPPAKPGRLDLLLS